MKGSAEKEAEWLLLSVLSSRYCGKYWQSNMHACHPRYPNASMPALQNNKLGCSCRCVPAVLAIADNLRNYAPWMRLTQLESID